MARKRLGEILVQAGVLDAAGLRAALHEQRKLGGQLGKVLVRMELLSEEVLVQALSRQLNFPSVDLDQKQVTPDVIATVSADLAEQHSLVPFAREGKFLDVAMGDPAKLDIIDELRILTQLNVRPYLAGPTAIERALARYYQRGEGSPVIDSGPPIAIANVGATAGSTPSAAATPNDDITALQVRLSQLEALVKRDEDVIRKLLGLLVEKGVATREEVLNAIK